MTVLVILLNYVATHTDARLRRCTSGMLSHDHRDGACASAPKARSRCGGCFLLSNDPTQTFQANLNGAARIICKIMNNSMR